MSTRFYLLSIASLQSFSQKPALCANAQLCSDVTSEESAITFNVYDRAVEDLGFLGTVQIKPVLIHDHTVDQWYKCVLFASRLESSF